MSYKVEQEFNKLLAMGIPEKMAKICACVKYGQEQEAKDEMAYLIEEQETIKEQLNNFVPFHENKPIVEEDCEDEKPIKKIKIPVQDVCTICEKDIDKYEEWGRCDYCYCIYCHDCYENDKIVDQGNHDDCVDRIECRKRRKILYPDEYIDDQQDKKPDLQHQL